MSDWLIGLLATFGFVLVLVLMGMLNTHRHKWRLSDAKAVTQLMPGVQLPQTILLYQCTRCPRAETKVITGAWERQLTSVRSEVEA